MTVEVTVSEGPPKSGPSRLRVLAGFVALGLFWGAWGAALPGVQRRAGVSDGELGVALLLVGLGALESMRATGHVIDRRGGRVTGWGPSQRSASAASCPG